MRSGDENDMSSGDDNDNIKTINEIETPLHKNVTKFPYNFAPSRHSRKAPCIVEIIKPGHAERGLR